MARSNEMHLKDIYFHQFDNNGFGIFLNNALPSQSWPETIEHNHKLFKFKKLAFMESWMAGQYAGAAEYEVVSHNTRPVIKYSKNDELTLISGKHFDTPTLEVRNLDRLDFYDCHVKNIKKALEEAMELGNFLAIINNHLLLAIEKEDETVELFYMDRYSKKNPLRIYPNMKELEADAKKFDFNFGL